MAATEEDEWEYEYDGDETEDFYIPIDLSHVPTSQKMSSAFPRTGHPVLLRTKLRAHHERREAEATIASHSISEDANSLGNLQLNGLHTENPLVMYEGQLLSCQWARNIGTDMFFAKPEPDFAGNNALRSLPDVDLIATGSSKLIANVAQLRPKDELFEGTVDGDQAELPIGTSGHSHPENGEETWPPPSNFLARLNAAKAKRGEKSRLVISKDAEGNRLAAEVISQEESHFAQERTEQDIAVESGDVVMTGT
jgi:hypothetical protein